MSPRQTLLSMGMNENDIDNHYSDLYVKVNEISKKFVEGYKFKSNVTTFICQRSKVLWYDIPFADHEYTEKRLQTLRQVFPNR